MTTLALLLLALLILAPTGVRLLGWGSEGECVEISLASSPEKARLVQDLIESFHESSESRVDGQCIDAEVHAVDSGRAQNLLIDGWREAGDDDGPPPTIWSPASSLWILLLNEELDRRESEGQVVSGVEPLARTPLVIAMPQSRAQALGWPDSEIGFEEVLGLALAARGPCELDLAPPNVLPTVESWCNRELGPFQLGKTNPNFSTSGLASLVTQAYAATGTTSGLTQEDAQSDELDEFARGIESAVAHYGTTTLPFLESWYRADQEGWRGPYVSAVTAEEKSVIDYNRGDPLGELRPGEQRTEPRDRLVAIYPKEGTFYSDNPLVVLDTPVADWVTDEQRAAAETFVSFATAPEQQERVLDYGFRPGRGDVAADGDLFAEQYGVQREPPVEPLGSPGGDVLYDLRERWEGQRRPARVLIVVDVSGSMAEPADPDSDRLRPTRLDLAQDAANRALPLLANHDHAGLWAFSTNLEGPDVTSDGFIDKRVDIMPFGEGGETLTAQISDLQPASGTPLYQVTEAAYEEMVTSFDPDMINAIVLLSDGEHRHGDPADWLDQQERLLAMLETEDRRNSPVRIFTIGFAQEAPQDVLQGIAHATGGVHYDSADPDDIEQIFVEVISNF